MHNIKTIIYGKTSIDEKSYDAEIINDVFVLRKELFDEELISKIVGHVVLFIPEPKVGPKYYLYIEKRLTAYYSGTSFKIQLLYRRYDDVEEKCFEIESKGFTNSINTSFNNDESVLDFIKNNLEKDLLSCNFYVESTGYRCSFRNLAKYKQNNLCPVDFTSCLRLIPADGAFVDKIKDVYDFSLKLLQFITINTYSIIDEIRIMNSAGGYAVVEIFDDYSDFDANNDKYLSIRPLEKNISQLLEFFPNGITRQYNLYHYKREWVFEFDIVRMSGVFEDVFRDNVEKSDPYRSQLNERKGEISYKELKKLLKDFSATHGLKDNEDFNFCRKLFDDYGGTLKNKLEFALNDFCETMDYRIIDNKFLYSPTLFETRLKDARNAVCHGLHNKIIDWRNAANDTLVLQEIIYFIILKYKMRLPEEQIRECLDISFGKLNKGISFYKKDDPRNKWID